MTVKNDGDLPKVLTGIMISDGSLFNREIVRGLLGNSDEYIPRDNLSAAEDVDCYDMVKLIVKRHPTWHAHALFGGSFVGIAGGFIAHDNNAAWLENIIGPASLGLFVFGFRSVHNRAQLINEFTKVCLQKNPYYKPRSNGWMRESLIIAAIALIWKTATLATNPVMALFSSSVVGPSKLERSDGSI